MCNKCREDKDINLFSKKSDTRDGYRTICKECQKNGRNKEYDAIMFKKWSEQNRLERNEYMRNYRITHNVSKDKKPKQTADEKREYNRIYSKKRRDSDPLYKLRKNIQRNILRSFDRINIRKNTTTQKILGCTFDEFKIHIENRFETWMNWENYGKYNGQYNYGWDIDHVIPVSSALNEEELTNLNHYTNLKPLCSKVNRNEKRDDVTHPNSH